MSGMTCTNTAGFLQQYGKQKWILLLDKPVSPQPVRLRLYVPVHNITFCILETPGSNDQGIAFPYPGPFLHLSPDSAHAGDPVSTRDTDVIGAEHRLGTGKLLSVPFFRGPYAGDRRTICIDCRGIEFLIPRFCVAASVFHETNFMTLYINVV